MIKRRNLLLGAALAPFVGCASSTPTARVVVIGGGFGGATAARTLKRLDPNVDVVLVEPKQNYYACPFSNLVLAGERPLVAQSFSYSVLVKEGISWIPSRALDIDPVSKQVTLENQLMSYDRLILSPGISLNYSALPGYTEQAASVLPHAWQAGPQTQLLREQLFKMKNGGLVVISVPETPYRCPPGPYERASLIAGYLKKEKPRSKVLLLDAKDRFSKQSLFESAWQQELNGYIEWQGRSEGAVVTRVNAERSELYTDFDVVRGDVVNVIPPQKAGQIALTTGIADRSGWCPVNALTFESTIAADVHVIGDAAILNAMPKSAFSANAQGKLCAVQVVRSLKGLPPITTTMANTCYSLVHTDYGISVAGVYRPDGERWLSVTGAGGVSPAEASAVVRRREARYAEDWFKAITSEAFL